MICYVVRWLAIAISIYDTIGSKPSIQRSHLVKVQLSVIHYEYDWSTY